MLVPRVPKATTASLDESRTARARQREVLDARAELLRSAPVQPPQPPPPNSRSLMLHLISMRTPL